MASGGCATLTLMNASANSALPAAAASRSGVRSASVYAPSALHRREWISYSGSVPASGSKMGRRRWYTLRGNSRLKNVHSHFSYCEAAGSKIGRAHV